MPLLTSGGGAGDRRAQPWGTLSTHRLITHLRNTDGKAADHSPAKEPGTGKTNACARSVATSCPRVPEYPHSRSQKSCDPHISSENLIPSSSLHQQEVFTENAGRLGFKFRLKYIVHRIG